LGGVPTFLTCKLLLLDLLGSA